MNEDRTFWECVYDARLQGQLPRVWKTDNLIGMLTAPGGHFSPNTVSVDPYNYSISKEGDKIGGYFVRRGQEPKAWRVGRGRFQLVVDPDDDTARQAAQRELAIRRAKELMADLLEAKIRRMLEEWGQNPTPSRDRQGQHKPRSKPGLVAAQDSERHARGSDRYDTVFVALDDLDLQEMAGLSTEQKAMYIVKKHIRNKHGQQTEIEDDRDGADLRFSVDGTVQRIEVKGTASKDLAWSQLKVSSQKSHDALKNDDALMYRAVDVDSEHPRIYILTYGQDFTLEPEPRWAVKQVRPEDDRYPLRGQPYRYDHPEDPVAGDDWETLE